MQNGKIKCSIVFLDAGMTIIRPAPQFETAMDARFITGLANVGERMLIVMNIEALLSNSELGMMAAALGS